MTSDLDTVLRTRSLALPPAPDGTPRVGVVDDANRLAHQPDAGVPEPGTLTETLSPGQFEEAVLDRYRQEILDRATDGLWHRDPTQSARQVLRGWQKPVAALLTILLVALVVLAPQATIVGLSVAVGAGFLVSVSFKFWTSFRGARMEELSRLSTGAGPAVRDEDLPTYTVLVPVYKEANIVAQLIENLGSLDYPVEKLEVLVLVEEDDAETREAALAADPPPHIRVVVVPDGQPRTKPRACNVGLLLATGEMLVIYDAEDRPEPDQLRKAVAAFRTGSRRLVCVQAALNYFNAGENALTRMFTLEYSFWFDYMLPGLEYGTLPIPLGGTSNHFRTDGLRRLGGWDPYNVTEDADLGIRASAEGLSVGVIDSTTYEEANSRYGNFIRQRSRWIKGYLQTTLVHLRRPAHLIHVAGLKQTLSFLFLVAGTPLTFLALPPLYGLFLLSLIVDPDQLSELFPGWALWLSLFNLGVGSVLMIYVSMMGAFKRQRHELVLWALLNPLYWLLHAVAAYKALWQLIVRPHYWEKTTHGLTRVDVEITTSPDTTDVPSGR